MSDPIQSSKHQFVAVPLAPATKVTVRGPVPLGQGSRPSTIRIPVDAQVGGNRRGGRFIPSESGSAPEGFALAGQAFGRIL
jgi:hypothetical protein